jgi:hypothetical protein
VFITGRPSNLDPPVIIIFSLNILRPRAPSFTLRILRFCVPAHIRRKRVVLLEGHLGLIADGFEPVSFVFFVPHAFVWVDAMGLPALDFFAMGACVLCWRLIVILLCFLLLFATCLGLFVLLAVVSAWFAFLLKRFAVGGGNVRRFGVLRVGVITVHH